MFLNLLTLTSLPLFSSGEGESPFEILFRHVVAQPAGELLGIPYFNLQYFQLLSVGLIFVLLAGVAQAVRTGSGNFLTRTMAGTIAWLRDDVVYPNLGKSVGKRFLPYFCSLFFFIALMNLIGLVPGGVTATGSVFVTGSLAALTLLFMIVGGMLVQGPLAFWKSLLPPGAPGWMAPALFFLEFLGLLVKPFALMMRLMANMTGGHLALLTFLGLLFHFGSESATVGWALSPAIVGLSVFMMLLEGFIALLQAYVFVLLTAIFVGMCLHPQH